VVDPNRVLFEAVVRLLRPGADFLEVLPGFLLPDAGSQGRRTLLEDRLRALCG
jgi:hypothetical protein